LRRTEYITFGVMIMLTSGCCTAKSSQTSVCSIKYNCYGRSITHPLKPRRLIS